MENEIEISARSEADYVVTRRWLSDLEFFRVEATFLHRLQQDYFIRSDDEPTIEKLKAIGHELLRLHADMVSADVQLNGQLKRIAAIAENEIAENLQDLTSTQVELGQVMARLIDEYREVKKQLFWLVESIMRETKN